MWRFIKQKQRGTSVPVAQYFLQLYTCLQMVDQIFPLQTPNATWLLPLSLTRKWQVAKPIPNCEITKQGNQQSSSLHLTIVLVQHNKTRKTKGLGQLSGGWAEPTRAEHTKGEEFGASMLFLSPSITCGMHESLPQLTEFSSSSADQLVALFSPAGFLMG